MVVTNVPADIGYMTVSGQLLRGIADSNDADVTPDARPAIGTVTFTSNAPVPTIAATDQIMFIIDQVKCDLDADGYLVAPTDGEGVAPTDTAVRSVNLIAPNQASLSNVGWVWTATVKPGTGQRWAAFTIKFTGVPGDVLDLSQAALAATTSSLTAQPVVWPVHGTTIPTGAIPGQFLFDLDTDNLYLIGA